MLKKMPALNTRNSVAGGRLIMLLTPTRVAYLGLLGAAGTRVFGAIAVYLSSDAPNVSVSRQEGVWETTGFAVIPAYESHRVRSEGRLVLCLLIEAESIEEQATLQFLQSEPEITARIRAGFAHLQTFATDAEESKVFFDRAFFGRPLPPRKPDSRIKSIVEAVRADPAAQLSAKSCAQTCQLSESRFLHLFTSEIGASFRRFRAWKRARSFLGYASETISATEVALDSGYPDSTHFSHSIRRFYGFKPTEIFAGSRQLMIISQPEDEVEAPQEL